MQEQDELVADPLFLALTRPALMMGVPIDAAVLIAVASTALLLGLGNPVIAIGAGGGMWMAARLIVRRDYNQFRVFFLFGRTKGSAPNKKYWKGSSFAPLPTQGMKRKGFGRV